MMSSPGGSYSLSYFILSLIDFVSCVPLMYCLLKFDILANIITFEIFEYCSGLNKK